MQAHLIQPLEIKVNNSGTFIQMIQESWPLHPPPAAPYGAVSMTPGAEQFNHTATINHCTLLSNMLNIN